MSASETLAYTRCAARAACAQMTRPRMCRVACTAGLSIIPFGRNRHIADSGVWWWWWSPSRTEIVPAFGVAGRTFACRKRPSKVDAPRRLPHANATCGAQIEVRARFFPRAEFALRNARPV